jgi:hypothetical protein
MSVTETEVKGPSVWGPGDPHKTWDDLVAEAPAGSQMANPVANELAAATDDGLRTTLTAGAEGME